MNKGFSSDLVGSRVAEWSGEPVSRPAILRDGGFDSRRRPDRRPSLPPGLRWTGIVQIYVAVCMHESVNRRGMSGIGRGADPPENANNYYSDLVRFTADIVDAQLNIGSP